MLRHKKQRTFHRHDKQSPLKLKDVSIQSKDISCWSVPELLERNEIVFCSCVENNLLKQTKKKKFRSLWMSHKWFMNYAYLFCFSQDKNFEFILLLRQLKLYEFCEFRNATIFLGQERSGTRLQAPFSVKTSHTRKTGN